MIARRLDNRLLERRILSRLADQLGRYQPCEVVLPTRGLGTGEAIIFPGRPELRVCVYELAGRSKLVASNWVMGDVPVIADFEFDEFDRLVAWLREQG
jgi:hypothetical protein